MIYLITSLIGCSNLEAKGDKSATKLTTSSIDDIYTKINADSVLDYDVFVQVCDGTFELDYDIQDKNYSYSDKDIEILNIVDLYYSEIDFSDDYTYSGKSINYL